jgi:hypothetical protein
MNIPHAPTKLPRSLHKFFWDVNAAAVNPQARPTYIINRLLDKGDIEGARWVLVHFPTSMIIASITRARDFSARSATFWARYFDIPKEDFLCLQEPYRALRLTHWQS